MLFHALLIASLAPGQGVSDQPAAFNVDVGLGPVARNDCAGDLAQPGLWNRFGVNEGERLPLVDVHGQASQAVLQCDDVATWVSCNTDQPGGDQELLGDGAQTKGEDQVWNLSGLEPGAYMLAVYGRADCTSGSTAVTVTGDDLYQDCQGRAERAEQSWGSVFLVGASQGSLEIRLSPASEESEVRLSGLQLQPLGEGQVTLLSVGSRWASIRSQGPGTLSAPSCVPLQSWTRAPIILRGGPVGLDFNVLQPQRSLIQTRLLTGGWNPEAGSAHAAMQWAGVPFWWQLGSRSGSLGDAAWL
ncbi:MAG: hypothetical protein P1V35_01500 [Planctomycetota bacterium]|nr:hypothetical protein [Planctomycetota bacterium]